MKKKYKRVFNIKNIGISSILVVLILTASILFIVFRHKNSQKIANLYPLSSVTTLKNTGIPIEQKEILKNILSAQNYYSLGEYMPAVDFFEKARLAIKESKLSDAITNELTKSFIVNYNKAKDIVDAANR